MTEYTHINYETVDDGRIARIILNRPRARNAQHRGLLVELGDAFTAAEADDTVRVVILSGAGPIFSSSCAKTCGAHGRRTRTASCRAGCSRCRCSACATAS